MARMWLPGAKVMHAQIDGGSMVGGPPRAVWHTVEAPYSTWSAYDAARYLVTHRNQPQIIFHPISGDVIQTGPANRAGRALANAAGGWQSNRAGRYCIQFEVVGYAKNPWTNDITDAGIESLRSILAWLDSLGIERAAPNGPPAATYGEANAPGHRNDWTWRNKSGHFQHSDVPEGNVHWDSGAIDIEWLLSLGHSGKIHVGTGSGSSGSGGGGKSWNMPNLNTAVLKALQKKVGVTPDGIEGPKTAKATQKWLGVTVDGWWGRNTISALQRKVGVPVDGIFGPVTASHLADFLGEHDHGSNRGIAVDGAWGEATTRAMQKWLGVAVDGVRGPNTIREFQDYLNWRTGRGIAEDGLWGPATVRAMQDWLDVAVDGVVGPNTVKAFQRALNARL